MRRRNIQSGSRRMSLLGRGSQRQQCTDSLPERHCLVQLAWCQQGHIAGSYAPNCALPLVPLRCCGMCDGAWIVDSATVYRQVSDQLCRSGRIVMTLQGKVAGWHRYRMPLRWSADTDNQP